MKKLLLLGCFLFPILLMAQSEGLIVYTESFQFKPDTSAATANDPRAAQFRTMFSNLKPWHKHLRFNAEATLYLDDPVEAAAPIDPDDMNARIRTMMRQENEVYRNLQSGEVVEYTDFMGKKFLITGEEPRKWKMSTEQKLIHGYPCMKATATDSMGTVEAWFTPQLPISSGPRSLGGLPGLILEANVAERFYITVDTIAFRPLRPEEPIAKPDKGKPVTREEYRAILKAKMEEMRQQGGGPNMMMRHR